MLHFCLDCYGICLVDGQRFDDRRSDVNPLEQSLLLLPLQRTTIALPPQKTSTNEMDGYNKHHLSGYGEQIISDSLGAHSLLMSTCVSELRSKSSLKNYFGKIVDT